jgi:hypothetical protein
MRRGRGRPSRSHEGGGGVEGLTGEGTPSVPGVFSFLPLAMVGMGGGGFGRAPPVGRATVRCGFPGG